MSACLALESPQRVWLCWGLWAPSASKPRWSSSVAGADLVYCANFDEVFHSTASGGAQFGVVGVENMTEGVVTRSLDLFLHTPCHVCGRGVC